jgi:pimeloyl-ACP methyl ester carboxylesterase
MDAIRQALGAEQASYFGFSYGSELGGVWATLFPSTVRAAVFDGAVDPNAGPLESTLQQGAGFEASLATFLAECSADTQCAFHNDGDAEGAFDRLMTSLDDSPLPSAGGRAPVNRGVAVIAVASAMYSDRYWPALERALEDAAAGDGAGLLQLYDSYYQRRSDGTYGNLIEAFQAINCADDAERPTVAESDADVPAILAAAPRIFPYTTGSYSCTFFPPALDPRIDITGVGAGPIVVVGTTGDPATPLESSRAMADTLEDGRLVVVEANEHTGYRGDECVRDLVHRYLLTLDAPEDGTTCS